MTKIFKKKNKKVLIIVISVVLFSLLLISMIILKQDSNDEPAETKTYSNEAIIFLDFDISDEEIEIVENSLQAIDSITIISFYSKEEVENNLRESSEAMDNIMAQWDADESPLQATFIIEVEKGEDMEESISIISNIDNVADVWILRQE